MPVVLVHGNPETEAIWNDLRQHLARKDVVTLSPPGFGAPVADDFGAKSDDYVHWLVNEVQALEARWTSSATTGVVDTSRAWPGRGPS